MNKVHFRLLYLLIAINGCFAFYYRKSVVSTGRQATDLREAKIVVTKESSVADKTFPDEFKLIYTQINRKEVNCVFSTNHSMIERPATASNLFIIDDSGDLKQVEGTDVAMESYWSAQCNGSALLHDNEYMKKSLSVNPSTKFSALITIDGENTHVDIVTVIYETRSVGKSGGETISKRVRYGVYQRDKIGEFGHDYAIVTKEFGESIKKIASGKKKRAFGGQPVVLYVECVLVADYSAYQKHMTNANSVDQNVVLLYMKIFYSHLLNSINRRYVNTFSSDPDIRIQVRLNNIVVHTTNAESTWSDPVNVGITGNAAFTYNGRLVVVATPTLTAFKDFMEARAFPFTYDHAIGIIDRDIFSDSGSTASTRTGVAGFAYVGAVCDTYRYSINEDRGFNSIVIIAHEIGHNLGAYHDGDSTHASACSTADNYIMTPTIGANSLNLQNYYKFSPCSIASFKSNLLDAATGALDSVFSCLANLPVNGDLETAIFNTSLAGQLWNPNEQCKLMYGVTADADTCTGSGYNTNICETIYCHLSGMCYSSDGRGALDGASCGTNQVCYNGVCGSSSVTLATNFPASPCGGTNPCQNGGACVTPAIGNFYMCNCPSGFGGQRCEISGVTTVAPVTAASTTRSTATTTTTRINAQAGRNSTPSPSFFFSYSTLVALLLLATVF